ncbi:MAG: BREX system Lon protease-like protein BrxL [Bacteroidales bacterium]|nr:BREX system Lon protease-like protein BrxL [Bacteroidales bacterium]
MESFIGKVVRKDLAFLVKGNLPVPTYVLEYLLGQYCATDDEEIIAQGLEKVKDVIRNNYINRAESEEIKGKIRENGRYRIIDKVTVVLNDKNDVYQATFANLAISAVPISDDIVNRNPKLLSGNGVWSIVTLAYQPGDEIKQRWLIESLKPIQISNVDVVDYIEQRQKFTTDEWIDFMIHTVGLNPDALNRREKFIVLSRLLPFVENNYNFMELGPKGTGKSHVFQELSPYGVLVSGGDVTSARLFVKMSGNKEILGLVGYWDTVAWDEYEQQKGKSVDPVLIDTMQNYLANKSFNRGKATHESSASMSFVGNTKHTVEYMLKNSHLFESIPTAFIKGAFLDRIHLYNPGWEIKMLKKDSFSKGYGLITDYISAILHELRKKDFSPELAKYAKVSGSLSERDHLAIRKTFSGMVKLLYPDGVFTEEEAFEIINFAAEGRKRVKDQLYVIDETFKAEPAYFEYEDLKKHAKVQVKTLEQLDYGKEDYRPAEPEPIPEIPAATTAPKVNITASPVPAKPEPKDVAPEDLPSTIKEIRMNQRGFSYTKLFGPYLKNVHRVELTDPFVRLPYQIDNLIEFINTVRQSVADPEGLEIHLSTANDDEHRPDVIDIFDAITDDLAPRGIEFTYDFDAVHDRFIHLDNGWKINLGRGLDIFDKVERFSIDRISQEDRRCKACSISFVRDEDQEVPGSL